MTNKMANEKFRDRRFCYSLIINQFSFLIVGSRQIPLCRAVISDIVKINHTERALASGFLNRMRGKANNAWQNEERAAVLPRDSDVRRDSRNHAVDVGG